MLEVLATSQCRVFEGDDPDRYLYIGFTSGGKLASVAILADSTGHEMVIHANYATKAELRRGGLII